MKSLKTKIIGAVMAFTMMLGSSTVMAAPDPEPSTLSDAVSITYGQNVHVEFDENETGKWYTFTPYVSGFYSINTTSYVNDPYIGIYDEWDRTPPGSFDYWDRTPVWNTQLYTGINNNYGANINLEQGTTYHLWVTNSDSRDRGNIIDFNIAMGVSQSIEIDGEVPNENVIVNGLSASLWDDYIRDHEVTLIAETDRDDDTFQWYRYNYFTEQYECIEGATSSHYTIDTVGDLFSVVVTDSDGIGSCSRRYSIYNNRLLLFSDITNSLADAGQGTSARAVNLNTDTDSSLHYIACPYYEQWANHSSAGYRNSRYWSTTENVNIPAFNVTTVDFIGVQEDYYNSERIEHVYGSVNGNYSGYKSPTAWGALIAFVKTPDNTSSIAVDSPAEVVLNPVVYGPDDYPGFMALHDCERAVSDCKVFTFTPSASGTYTVSSSDLVTGIPYMAIFDENYNWIGTTGFYNDSYFFECCDNRDCGTPTWERTVGTDFTHSLHLDAGKTYYFVAWSMATTNPYSNDPISADMILGQYTVTLTCDSLDPVSEQPSGEANASTSRESSGDANTSTSQAQQPTPTPAIPAATNNPVTETGVAGFVERLYTIALGRASDPVGKQDWIDAITLRGESGASCARGFLYSPEFLNKGVSNEEFVAVLYRTFFNREPDQAGFNAWVGVLNNGTSKEEVIEGFINSTEWANLCLFYGIRNGGTGVPSIEIEPNQQTIDFATRLYTTCLGRNADQNGLMAWARQLANQRDTGTGAARGFFFSSEFTGQNVSNGEYVTRLYRTFMNREPDQAGYDAWVGQLDSGVSWEEVFDGFAQSIEFARICAQYGIVR